MTKRLLLMALVVAVAATVLWVLLPQESETTTNHQNSPSVPAVEEPRLVSADSAQTDQAVATEFSIDASPGSSAENEPDIFTEVDESELNNGVLADFMKERPVYRYRFTLHAYR